MTVSNFIIVSKKLITAKVAKQILFNSEMVEGKVLKHIRTNEKTTRDLCRFITSGSFLQIYHNRLQKGDNCIQEIIRTQIPQVMTVIETIDLNKQA